MPTCRRCGRPMAAAVVYRKLSVAACGLCEISAEVFLDVELEICEIDECMKEIFVELLLTDWLQGAWEDMSALGLDDQFVFQADCPALLPDGLRLAELLQDSCDYPWSLLLRLVGSGTERRFGGLGAGN